MGINVGGQTYGPGQNKASFGWYNTDNTFATYHSIMTITSDAKIGINQSSPYADVDITSSVEDANNGTLSNHGIRLSHAGATDEEVIPITAGFLNNQDRARAGIGFISKTVLQTFFAMSFLLF